MSDQSRCVSLVTSDWFGEDEYCCVAGGSWAGSVGTQSTPTGPSRASASGVAPWEGAAHRSGRLNPLQGAHGFL
jgi:hypothetical protein